MPESSYEVARLAGGATSGPTWLLTLPLDRPPATNRDRDRLLANGVDEVRTRPTARLHTTVVGGRMLVAPHVRGPLGAGSW